MPVTIDPDDIKPAAAGNVNPGIAAVTNNTLDLNTLGASSVTVLTLTAGCTIAGVTVPVGTYQWGIDDTLGALVHPTAFIVDTTGDAGTAIVLWTI